MNGSLLLRISRRSTKQTSSLKRTGLEGGMQKTLQVARDSGVKFFTASDYITVRHVGTGEGIPSGDPDQAIGAADPHLWMDPLNMKSIVSALAPVLMKDSV